MEQGDPRLSPRGYPRRDGESVSGTIVVLLGVVIILALASIFYPYAPAERSNEVGPRVEAPGTTTPPATSPPSQQK